MIEELRADPQMLAACSSKASAATCSRSFHRSCVRRPDGHDPHRAGSARKLLARAESVLGAAVKRAEMDR